LFGKRAPVPRPAVTIDGCEASANAWIWAIVPVASRMQALCRKNTQLRAIWQSSPTSKVVFSIHFTDIAKQLAPGRCVT
jgi:hypothetical protein